MNVQSRRRWSTVFGVSALAVCFLGIGSAIEPLSAPVSASVNVNTWTGQTITGGPITASRSMMAYGDGKFVAVFTNGTNTPVLTSTNGTTWIPGSAGNTGIWYGMTFGNGTFVVVGNGSGGSAATVMTSTDGISWTAKTLDQLGLGIPFVSWYDVTYGNGQFVAVGSQGRVMSSPDGATWTLRSTPSTISLEAVTYGNGQFVAVGAQGGVMTSPDGIAWTLRTTPDTSTHWYGVTYGTPGPGSGSPLFVAVAAFTGGTNAVMTSTNGIAWTLRTSPATPTRWHDVTYGDGVFVAVAFGGNTDSIMTSTDGTTWTLPSYTGSGDWDEVVYGDGLFVTMGNSGSPQIMTSGTFVPPSTTAPPTTAPAPAPAPAPVPESAPTTTVTGGDQSTSTSAPNSSNIDPQATVDGSPVPIKTVTDDDGDMLIQGPDFSLSFDKQGSREEMLLDRGDGTRFRGNGFKPNSQTESRLLKADNVVELSTTDRNGSFRKQFAIPKDTPSGSYQFQFKGTLKSGGRLVLTMPARVGRTNVDVLPSTGSHDTALATFGVLLLMFGVVVARRRINP